MQETEAPPPALTERVEVKGWRNGLLLILPEMPDQDWEEVLAQVQIRLGEAQARSFWRGAQVTFICGSLRLEQEQISRLIDLIKGEFGLVPVAAVTTNENTRVAAQKLALTIYDELPVIRKAEPSSRPTAEKSDAGLPGSLPHNALYLTQTVRSGQRIVHHGHLVIVGDINPGAEIMASGDIVVVGTLRGVAHAGCFGDESARIIALSLRPPQLRIASRIARSPEENAHSRTTERRPEVARIVDGEIGVFPL